MAGRILVVDDAVEIVEFLRSLLGQLGHEVIAAHDGESGLRKFADELPDLVLLDLLLPRRDGSEVCAEIKRSPHGLITPVAIITGVYKNQSKMEAMRHYGVVDYLIKPIPVPKITALVEWALGAKLEEDTTPDEDFELLRLQPLPDRVTPRIEEAALPGLLARAEAERASGVLFASRGKLRKALLIEEGRIVGIRSNAPADRIDRVLLAMRKVSPQQMAAVRAAVAAHGGALAAAIALGHLGADEGLEARRYQAMMAGLSLFRWNEGVVCFLPGERIECPRLEQAIEPARLALIGLRRSPALREAILRRNLDESSVLRRPLERARRLRDSDLAHREREVFDMIDGERSMKRLRQIGVLAQLAVDEAVAVLLGAGLVEAAAETSPISGAGALEQASEMTGSGARRAGTLDQTPLAEILGELGREEATGTIAIEGEVRRQIVIQKGHVIYARSSAPGERLGAVLVDLGMIATPVLDEALRTQSTQRPDRRLGSLLVEMGALSLAGLEVATRTLLERQIEAGCALIEGSYCFEPGDTSAAVAPIDLGYDLLGLLRLGIAAMDPAWLRARWISDSRATVLVAVEGVVIPRGLSGEEADLLARAAEEVAVVEFDGGPEGLRRVELLIAAGLAAIQLRDRPCALTIPASMTATVPEVASAPATGVSASDIEDAETIPIVMVTAESTRRRRREEPEPEAELEPGREPERECASMQLLLDFLRVELLGERRAAEHEVQRLREEVGRLGEVLRQLGVENQRLIEAVAAAAGPGLPPPATTARDPAPAAETAEAPAVAAAVKPPRVAKPAKRAARKGRARATVETAAVPVSETELEPSLV